MRRWVTIGALVLVGAWAPFLYRELTSEEVEKKDAAFAADATDEAPVEAIEPAAGAEAHAAGRGSAEPAEAPAPAEPESPPAVAEPQAQAPEAPGADPSAAPTPTALPADPAVANPVKVEEGEPEEEAPPPPPDSPASATAVFQRAFDSEPRDALWAREAEARLLQVMTGAAVPIETIKTARCQKTVCRLEVVWKAEDAHAYAAAYKAVREEFGDDLGVHNLGAGEAEGEQRIDLYVPRRGYTLADLSR
jgi:hypothetical protein